MPCQHCLLPALSTVALPCWLAAPIARTGVRCVHGLVSDRVVAGLQHKDAFEVQADLPGVNKDAISVKVNIYDAQQVPPPLALSNLRHDLASFADCIALCVDESFTQLDSRFCTCSAHSPWGQCRLSPPTHFTPLTPGVAVVFCNASALHGIGPPVLSSEGAVLHASAHLHHSMAI